MKLNRSLISSANRAVDVELFRLENDNGAQVYLTNYGGIVTKIVVPDQQGNFENICLGFDDVSVYLSPAYKSVNPRFGAIIGRYANRISNGMFEIEGEVYQVSKNHNGHTLHGGFEGFDQKTWEPETFLSNESSGLKLSYMSPDGDEGFPGNLKVSVIYELNNRDELTIEYLAESDAITPVNLTNHTYFNLSGCKRNIDNHIIQIEAELVTEANDQLIPTGKFCEVTNTDLDFRIPKRLGPPEKESPIAFDNNFVLKNFNHRLRKVAIVFDPDSGRKMEIESTEPGMQLYSADHLEGTLRNQQTRFSSRMGVCFETQHFPDSPNQPGFPSTLLHPGEVYSSKTIYRFTVE